MTRGTWITGALLAGGLALTGLGNPEREASLGNVAELWWDIVRDADGLGLQLSRVSAGEEMSAGAKLAKEYLRGVETEPVWERYVADVGAALVPHVGRKDIRYEFHVIDGPIANAFALPGGHIMIYTTLLEQMKSEAELASVLGHEIGHVDSRHCVERLQYELRMNRLGIGELGKLTDFLRRIPAQGYSQYQELDADGFGVRAATAAGYDPQDGIAFMRRLFAPPGSVVPPATPLEELANVGLSSVFDYFRSHPPTRERLRRMQALAAEARKAHAGKSLYRGAANFTRRIPMSKQQFPSEIVKP